MYRFILVLWPLMLITACRDTLNSNQNVTPPFSEQEDLVVLTLAVEENNLSRYLLLLELFEQEHPDIRVRLVSVNEAATPGEINEIHARASSFDIFPYSFNRQGDTQYLLDLRPFLALDPNFNPGDFLAGLLPVASEPLWAIPTGAAYYLTFFDKNAFDAAGLSYPELEWTTDEFLAAALALTLRDDGNVTRWGYVPGQLRYSPLLAAQLTGTLATGNDLRLTDPDVTMAVQWISDLFTLHQVSPWLDDYKPANRRTGSGGQSALALINSGMAAMWHSTHLLFDENNENVGVTTIPHGQYGLTAEPIVYGFAVSRGTNHPEAAWQLLHFLSRQRPQEALAPLLTPARHSVAVSIGYWDQLPSTLIPALKYTVENNVTPRIPYQAVPLLMEAFVTHIDDDVPVAVALSQIPTQVTALPDGEETVMVAVPTLPAKAGEDTIQITFYTSVSFGGIHRLLANQFQRENPNIQVHIIEPTIQPGVPVASLLNRAASSDCFMGGSLDLTHNDLPAALLPIGPFIDLDAAIQIEDFYPSLLNELTLDGNLLGIPAGVLIPYLEYNRRLFQEAGISEPSLDWTLADFLRITQQLTKGEGETRQYGYVEPLGYSLLLRGIDGFGVQLWDENDPIPHFDYVAATEMVTWYADLIRLYKVQPVISNDQLFTQLEILLREERVAIWQGGFANFLHFMDRPFPNLDIGVATEPMGPSGHRARLTVEAYYIFANTPHPAACWEWLKFLALNPTATYARQQASRLLPGHIETAESEEYIALVGTQMAAVGHTYMNATATDQLPPLPPWMHPGFNWLIDAYYAVATGESDVAIALAQADARFSQYRQCVIDANAFNDQTKWNECAGSIR